MPGETSYEDSPDSRWFTDHVVFYIEKYKDEIPFYHLRFIVKPGITGWAQVNYGYGAGVKDAFEKLQYDLYYIKNLSIALDLVIIIDTIKTVVLRRGAR